MDELYSFVFFTVFVRQAAPAKVASEEEDEEVDDGAEEEEEEEEEEEVEHEEPHERSLPFTVTFALASFETLRDRSSLDRFKACAFSP